LNVLIVARYADRRGGADVYTEGLAAKLSEENNVSLLCHEASSKVHESCCVTEISEPSFHTTPALWRLAPLRYQRHWQQAIKRIEVNSPDVIVSSMPLSSKDLLNRFPGTPLVYLPHSRLAPVEASDIAADSRIQRSVARRLYHRCEKWSLNHAATTVRFTNGNARELRSFYGLSSKANFSIVPAPVEHVGPAKIRPAKSPVKLVSVGRLVESKNMHWLLDCLAKIKSEAWSFAIVGDGPQRAQLERRAEQLQIADRVTFAGFCENVGDIAKAWGL